MKVFYFGPLREAGHFLWSPRGHKASREEEKVLPWPHIDGVLQPGCMFHFLRFHSAYVETEGEAILHYREGWTALCFWDRSVDTRGACNSNYFAEGNFTFAEMVDIAKKAFPERWALMKFSVVESPTKRNALLCSGRPGYASHEPAIVHRSGSVSAEVLNCCGACGEVIGSYCGQWVTLDSWGAQAVREGRRITE